MDQNYRKLLLYVNKLTLIFFFKSAITVEIKWKSKNMSWFPSYNGFINAIPNDNLNYKGVNWYKTQLY